MNTKITKLISTSILTLILSGCVTPQEVTPVIKAEPAVYSKPTSINPIMVHAQAMKVKAIRKQIVKQAISGVGVPYVYSGMSRSGWDCSGFTAYVYGKFGIQLEHSATKQAHSAKPNRKPQAGDLVAFSRGDGYWYYHVGIYIGNGKVVNANSYYGRTVVEPITNYKGDKITYINVIK
jgi:cell wall-associated NlpC family hydrolase